MNTQSISLNHTPNTPTNEVDVSYESQETFKEHLLYASMQQASIFKAMKLIKEVDKLNNQQVLNGFEIRKVKSHFLHNENVKIKTEKSKLKNENIKNENIKSQNAQTEIPKVKTDNSQIHITVIEKPKNKKRNPYDELQKGYMKMFSQ